MSATHATPSPRATRLRRAWRWVRRVVLAVLGFALVFPLLHRVVATTRETVAPPAMPTPVGGRYTVYVVDWGYHTAVVVPQAPEWRLGPPRQEAAPYLEYAWGDRRFYRDSDYRPHALFATLVLPTASVTYLAARDRPPTTQTGARAVYRRGVDATTLRALLASLEGSIVRDAPVRDAAVRDSASGRVHPTAPVPGYGGRFYEAHGGYMWTRNCNAWTVARLADAGLANRSALTVFSGQVAGRLQGFEAVR